LIASLSFASCFEHAFAQALGFPLYWKCPFFNFAGGDRTGHVTKQSVLDAYQRYDFAVFTTYLGK